MIEIVLHDCLLYAHQTDDSIHVYRSALVRDADPIYRPVLALVGDSEPEHRETVTDAGMMFRRAEHLVYRLDTVPVAA